MIQVIRETHEAPASIQKRIARAGGLNRYGEPNFRVVWGGSRLTWIGGRWTDRDASDNIIREAIELRQVPKYFPHDRWHIERWTPPEFYGSPEIWYAQTIEVEDGIRIPTLGPYPARGEYEHSFTLERGNVPAAECRGVRLDRARDRLWEWREDKINPMGATQSITVWIRYEKVLPLRTLGTDPVQIRSQQTRSRSPRALAGRVPWRRICSGPRRWPRKN